MHSKYIEDLELPWNIPFQDNACQTSSEFFSIRLEDITGQVLRLPEIAEKYGSQ